MTKLAAALLLIANAAHAQSWRADLESGQDAWGLIVVVCLGIGYVYVKGEFQRGQKQGQKALAIVAAIAVAAMVFPPMRILLALLTLAFLLYGLFNRS